MQLQKRIPEAKKIRLLIGFLSGLSVGVLPKSIRRFIVYLLLSRSFEVGARILKSYYLRRKAQPQIDELDYPVNEELFSSHEIVGFTCISMTAIITAWFQYPHLVPKGYLTFLQSINNLTAKQVHAVTCVSTGQSDGHPDLLELTNGGRMCRTVHDASQPCLDFYTNFIFKGVVTRTGPFYLKLYFLPLIVTIVKRRGRVSVNVLKHFMIRVWWSSLFLATMNATVAGTVCFLSKYFNSVVSQRYQLVLGGTMCGVPLYLEQEARRLELALYLFGQAIQISVNAYTHMGWWAPIGMDIITSAASLSLISYAYWEREEDGQLALIRPGYTNLLSKIIDTKNTRHGFQL